MILKKCPDFNELEDVFGYKEPTFIVHALDTESTQATEVLEATSSRDGVIQMESENETTGASIYLLETDAEVDAPLSSAPAVEVDANHLSAPFAKFETQSPENDLLLESNMSENIMIPKKSRKGIYSRTALSNIMQVQTQLIKMKSKKSDIEVQLKEKELELQKDRFLFDKQSRLEELKLKEKEIESNEKLKIMEIQMKENIALKELEIRERIELEKLKHAK